MPRLFDRLDELPLADWDGLYRLACAEGCGAVVDREEEALALADELVALAVPELVSSAVLATAAGADDDRFAAPLARQSAAAIRLLDRALAAHARDRVYDPAAWRARIPIGAAVTTSDLRPHGGSLPGVVMAAADAVAGALEALPRDTLAVPAALVDALEELLVLYAWARDDR